MALAGLLSGQGLSLLLLPASSSRAQLLQQTFRNSEQLLHVTIGFRTEVGAIENRDLKKDLSPVVPLRREHHAMSRRVGMFTGA